MDRFNVNISFSKNWEHLQTKFVSTGRPVRIKRLSSLRNKNVKCAHGDKAHDRHHRAVSLRVSVATKCSAPSE